MCVKEYTSIFSPCLPLTQCEKKSSGDLASYLNRLKLFWTFFFFMVIFVFCDSTKGWFVGQTYTIEQIVSNLYKASLLSPSTRWNLWLLLCTGEALLRSHEFELSPFVSSKAPAPPVINPPLTFFFFFLFCPPLGFRRGGLQEAGYCSKKQLMIDTDPPLMKSTVRSCKGRLRPL